jgi:hypothetical protein
MTGGYFMHVESGNGEQLRDIKGIWDFAVAARFATNCVADVKSPPLGNFCRAGY